jgi:hypothetical protein
VHVLEHVDDEGVAGPQQNLSIAKRRIGRESEGGQCLRLFRAVVPSTGEAPGRLDQFFARLSIWRLT